MTFGWSKSLIARLSMNRVFNCCSEEKPEERKEGEGARRIEEGGDLT